MSTLECPDANALQDLLLGKLPEESCDEFERHLQNCDDCQETCNSLAARDELTTALCGATVIDSPLPGNVEQVIPRLQQLDVRFTTKPQQSDDVDVRVLLAPAEEDDEIGRFGGYRVLRYLGQGGMGLVFEAEDPHLGRRVALKILNPVLAASRLACRRFERETQAAAAFEHDHIITIYHVGEEARLPFMVMQLLEGESLQDRLDRVGKLSGEETRRIGCEIADGLAAAHARGLLHRDIKPDNIWLQAGSDRVKILDFGLARLEGTESRLTAFGSVIGTPEFMAPEQAEGSEVDERCDLFSLGTLMYRCVTGEAPFRKDSAVATLVAVSQEEVSPANATSGCTDELSDVIVALMEKQPDDRPESASEVGRLLGANGCSDELFDGLPRPSQGQDGLGRPSYGNAVACGLPGLLAGILLTVIITVQTNHGTLTVEAAGDDFATTIQGESLIIREVATGKEIKVTPGANRISPGEYEFDVQSLPDGVTFSTPKFSIFRGGEKRVGIRFDAKTVGTEDSVEVGDPAVVDGIPDSTDSHGKTPADRLSAESPPSETQVPTDDVEPITVIANPEFDYSNNKPMGPQSLVSRPRKIPGVKSWTIEPKHDAVRSSEPVLSQNRRWLAAIGNRGTVRVWDLMDAHKSPRVLFGHDGDVMEVAWSQDGNYLASRETLRGPGFPLGRILIRDTRSFRVKWELHGGGFGMCWLPSENEFVLLDLKSKGEDESQRRFSLFRPKEGRIVKTKLAPYREIFSLVASSNRSHRGFACFGKGGVEVRRFSFDEVLYEADVPVHDLRFRHDGDGLNLQTKPKAFENLSLGTDDKRQVARWRFETWDIDYSTQTHVTASPVDETLVGARSVIWNSDGDPYIVEWPEDEEAGRMASDVPIVFRRVGGKKTGELSPLPGVRSARQGWLAASGSGLNNRTTYVCSTSDGLYIGSGGTRWRHWADTTTRPVVDGVVQRREGSLAYWVVDHEYSGWKSHDARFLDVDFGDLSASGVRDWTDLSRTRVADASGKVTVEVERITTRQGGRSEYQDAVIGLHDSDRPVWSQRIVLRSTNHHLFEFQWSADGNTLAILPRSSSRLQFQSDLIVLHRTDRSADFQKTALKPGKEWHFAWSPTGAEFAIAGPETIEVYGPDAKLRALMPLAGQEDSRSSRVSRFTVKSLLWVGDDRLFGEVTGRTSNRDQTAYLWKRLDAENWEVTNKFVSSGYSPHAACLSPQQERIAYGKEKIHVAELSTGLVQTFEIGQTRPGTGTSWEPFGWLDERNLAVTVYGRNSSALRVLNLESGESTRFPERGQFVPVPGGIICVQPESLKFYDAASRLDHQLVVTPSDRLARIFPDGQCRVNEDDPAELLCVAVLDDGTPLTLPANEFAHRFRDHFPDGWFSGLPKRNRRKMKVYVTDSNGQAIQGAEIFRNHVYRADEAAGEADEFEIENRSYRTDVNGEATIDLSGWSHDLRLWVRHPDFLPLHSMWTKDLQNDGGSVPRHFRIEMSRPEQVQGVVTDANGDPVANTEIQIRVPGPTSALFAKDERTKLIRPVRADGEYTVVTDNEGRWSCLCLPSERQLRKEADENVHELQIRVMTSAIINQKTGWDSVPNNVARRGRLELQLSEDESLDSVKFESEP